MTINPYEVLGVSKTASEDDVKKAFKRKAVEYHPDKTNGDKEKEDKFKEINEAYSILSDSEKRKLYDMGLYDSGAPPPGGGGHEMNFNDIFSTFFGGGGPPGGMPFGFNFGGGGRSASKPKKTDVVGINLTLNDIFYGTTKNIEFELLDKCTKCNGTGANDPNSVIKCMTCQGTGMFQQRLSPFMISTGPCFNCQGKGEIRTGKACGSCKGDKTVYKKRTFALKLPKGLPAEKELHMEHKGAYDPSTGEYNDIVFKLNYSIPQGYKVDQNHGHVEFLIKITIDDLLGGFEKTVMIYNEKYTFMSDGYFNPNNSLIIGEKGIIVNNNKKAGDLHIKFEVEFTEGERLIKYKEIMHKIYKRSQSSSDEESVDKGNIVHINRI